MARFFTNQNTTVDALLDNRAQAEALTEVINMSKEQVQGSALSVNAKTNTLIKAGPLDLRLKTPESYVTQAINRIDANIVQQNSSIFDQNTFMADTIGNVGSDIVIKEKFESFGGNSLIEEIYDANIDYNNLVNALITRERAIFNTSNRFVLNGIPIINSVHDVRLFINSVEYLKGVHYTVTQHAITRKYQVTWTFTEEAGGFDLEADFDGIVEYLVIPTPTV